MKISFSLILCLAGLPLFSLTAKEKLDLYLMIGQSNMAGRAPIEKLESGKIENCLLLDTDNKWVEASNPLNRYSSIRKSLKMQKLGPSYSFAMKILDGHKGKIGLIVNAKGGSKIDSWTKGQKFYDDAVKRTKAALAHPDYAAQLKGICWHQGESNVNDEQYNSKLEVLITSLRADFQQPKLPFVAGQINPKAGDAAIRFNKELLKIKKKVQKVEVVSAEGLKAYDKWHFDSKSVIELGRRYAEAMLKLSDAD